MNRKGQVLVAFLLFLPVMILLISMLYDFGSIGLEKRKAASDIKEAITYGLKNIDDVDIKDKIDNLLINNIDNIEKKEINIKSNIIEITITLKVEGNFEKMFDDNLYKINLKYSGYIENGIIKIKEW